MNSTYAQKSSTVQKAAAPNAASVLDSSAQNESLQRKADMANSAAQRAEAPRPNNTGMPDNLKAGIESLSGFSMDDVRVHYNSSKPATVQALAYTQGTDIHVAPGQEKCLPHEAWHVAQQMAGRVSPTTNINGMPVNDNAALEHEADVMGEKAVTQKCVNAVVTQSSLCKDLQKKQSALQLKKILCWGPGGYECLIDENELAQNKFEKVGNNAETQLYAWEWFPNENVYKWKSPRDSCLWYMNSEGMMWYEKMDGNNKVISKSEKKMRSEWVKLHDEWAELQPAKFGMEIELDRESSAFIVNEKKLDECRLPQTELEHIENEKKIGSDMWVWVPKDDMYMWSSLIDGCQWYADRKQLMWYEKIDGDEKFTSKKNSWRMWKDHFQKYVVTPEKMFSYLSELNDSLNNPDVGKKVNEVKEINEVKEVKTSEHYLLPPPCRQKEKNVELENKDDDENDSVWKDTSLYGIKDVGRGNVTKNDVGKVKEESFKAKQIFSIADGLVDVTFDTDTNYDSTRNDNALTIELVFNSAKIPLNDDMNSIGQNLVYEIERLTYEKIKIEKENKIKQLIKEISSLDPKAEEYDDKKMQIDAFKHINLKNVSGSVYDKHRALNIHVTVACPLQNIKDYLRFTVENEEMLKSLANLNDVEKSEVISFFGLFSQLENSLNDDPKQKMEVMNRTCFGQIFSLMQKNARDFVLKYWNFIDFEFKYCPVESDDNIVEKDADIINKDPSYVAKKFGKYGISQRGGFVEAGCPLFEFRGKFTGFSDSLKFFPPFMEKIAKKFNGYIENAGK